MTKTSQVISYLDFLKRKVNCDFQSGFDPIFMPDWLFDFQSALVDWAIKKGRAAIFADCGLGKTPMQLAWAENIHRKTNRPVMIVAPLAVSAQTVREGEKFGIEVRRSDDGIAYPGINTTNYERLGKFNPLDFAGTVCDESSVIKAFHGRTRELVTDFMLKQQYRLLATATAAPNDWIELGTSSEALGELNRTDMLSRFFKHDEGSSIVTGSVKWVGQNPTGRCDAGWRLKGHAVEPFWRWVSSWARAMRKPSDLGFDDSRFILPELIESEHLIKSIKPADDMLFNLPAIGLGEQREEARRTLNARCDEVANLVNDTGQPAIAWCHLNDEADTLEKMIPDSVQVAGRHSADYKEKTIMDFIDGNIRVLVSKPKIFGWGLNLQHCAHMTFFPTHSYESYYQALRRCWRFGQDREVHVDIVTTEGGRSIMENMERKSHQADEMFSQMIKHMNDTNNLFRINHKSGDVEIPKWLAI